MESAQKNLFQLLCVQWYSTVNETSLYSAFVNMKVEVFYFWQMMLCGNFGMHILSCGHVLSGYTFYCFIFLGFWTVEIRM